MTELSNPNALSEISERAKHLVRQLEHGEFAGMHCDNSGESDEVHYSGPDAVDTARGCQKAAESLRDDLRTLRFDEPALDQLVFDGRAELEIVLDSLQHDLMLVELMSRPGDDAYQIDTVKKAMRRAFELCQRPLMLFACKCALHAQTGLECGKKVKSRKGTMSGSASGATNPKLRINARMLELLQAKPSEVMGWNSARWAKHLKCAKSSVAETVTWKDLMMARERMNAERAIDRRRKPKASDRNRTK